MIASRSIDGDFGGFAYEQLDNLALLACQKYNFGNATDWFGEFRGGLYGFYSRMYGVRRHFDALHRWSPTVTGESEYELSTLFFHMDSALECLTFALNALGFGVAPSKFRSVCDRAALRRVSVHEVIGERPLTGFREVFPSLRALWLTDAPLIRRIQDTHDVSKHRKHIFRGGQLRSDAPQGFYEAFGLAREDWRRIVVTPYYEVLLDPDPKVPLSERAPTPYEDRITLESLVPSFLHLISQSGNRSLADARRIPLKERQLMQ